MSTMCQGLFQAPEHKRPASSCSLDLKEEENNIVAERCKSCQGNQPGPCARGCEQCSPEVGAQGLRTDTLDGRKDPGEKAFLDRGIGANQGPNWLGVLEGQKNRGLWLDPVGEEQRRNGARRRPGLWDSREEF